MRSVRDILRAFCSRTADDVLNEPFAAGPCLYGTDNAIAFRLPQAADPDVRPGELKTGIRLAGRIEAARARVGVPLVCLAALPRPLPCIECSGSGRVGDCPECDGGIIEDGGTDRVCPGCSGRGQVKAIAGDVDCLACHGSGEADEQAVKVGSSEYKRRYLALIASLPGVQIGLPTEPNQVLYFRCAIGDGALAALKTGD